jgi:hypothetical protein
MRYRELDENRDMQFGNQQADFLRDSPDAVAQAVLTRFGLWVGEWFLDTDAGTPYEQSMLGTHKAQTIEPAIRQRILETEGVTGIVELQLISNPNTRNIQIISTIDTTYGQTEITGVL